MKGMARGLSNFIITIMITALLLSGAVPSFTWKAWAAETDDTDTSVVLPAITIDMSDAPKVHGKNAIVIDLDTGTVVYEKNADKVIEPASVTKILNFLVDLDTLDLDQVITIPEDVETDGSCIWLEPGEKITVEELYYGMMLESGNDAAQVLGLAAGDGSLSRFSDMMNARAKECGAEHTDFKNPNGLNEDRSKLNYTTARDLALISREAMKYPIFREVVGASKHTIPETNKSDKRKLVNSNVCLWLKSQKTTVGGKEVPFKYEGCSGIKTGYTSDAGYCFVGSAARNGSEFLVVTMNAEDSEERFQDAIKLWDYAFGKYETYKVMKAGDEAGVCKVRGGKTRLVPVGIDRDLGVTIHKGTADEQEFTTSFRLDQKRIDAPVQKGQKLGQALVFNKKGRLVGAENLYALKSVGEGGPLSWYGIADEDLPLAAGIAGGILLLILILIIVHIIRRRKGRRRQQDKIRGELGNMRTAGVGMTATEITDLTGVEEFVPIPRGPRRISNEELNAWTSTSKRAEAERRGESRFGGRTPRGSYSKDTPAPVHSPEKYSKFTNEGMPKMNISPRTPFTAGTTETSTSTRTSQSLQKPEAKRSEPRRSGMSLSDEELFAMLESTEVYDANQPRRHGKLTDAERSELMRRTRRSRKSAGKPEEK